MQRQFGSRTDRPLRDLQERFELLRIGASVLGTRPYLQRRLSVLLTAEGLNPQTHLFPNLLSQQQPIQPTVVQLGLGQQQGDPNAELFDILTCPVCYDTILPPLYSCPNGHSLCNSCRPQVTECPTCRGPTPAVRNTLMERYVNSLLLKCSNQGCTERFHLRDRDIHEANCAFKLG